MRLGFSGTSALLAASLLTSTAGAVPEHVLNQRLSEPVQATARADLQGRLQGSQTLIVRLTNPPATQGGDLGTIETEQQQFMARCLQLPGNIRVLARVQRVLNAVFVEVDAELVSAIRADQAATRVAPVANYEMDLSETVPYIGAADVQATGVKGKGIKVAVLDSGVDYLHANLGGSGDPAEHAANDPTVIEDGTFPTAKVVAGFDFVGDVWPNGDLAPDPDPLDLDGHGTHVADIIGGRNGVAPDVDIYAVSVCSSVSSSCSGIALIQGMEFAVDPNGDGKMKDRVDIINMSLGSNYGQPFDDDLAFAVNNASQIGVITVASAGNGNDRPYVTGTPAAADTAISVAQTAVPSAALQTLVSGEIEAPAVFQLWSVPLTETISGTLQYGDGAGGNLDGCAPFAPGSLDGLVVLVDRGACNFTLKISNISQAGGALGIIGLIAAGAPFSGGDGGDRPIDIPGYMITQADSLALQAAAAGGATLVADPANQIPLVGSMVGSSSRGPSNTNRLKPEIGAPGASVSAEAGTGTGETPFGGTSGAAPMVAGTAALLLDARGHEVYYLVGRYSHYIPQIVKAFIVNTGDAPVERDFTGSFAEMTRIGGGEVRANRAISTPAFSYSMEDASPAISLGFNDISKKKVTFRRKIKIKNMSNKRIAYAPFQVFLQPEDIAQGAVTVSAPKKVSVGPWGVKFFNVKWTVDGTKLGGNTMNSGSQGANPTALTEAEYDGYLVLGGLDGTQTIHLPWTLIPRKAADVRASARRVRPKDGAVVKLKNRGIGDAQLETFTLVAESPNLPEGPEGGQAPQPDLAFVGVRADAVPAGFCGADPSFVVSVAINTHERQSHLLPVIPGMRFDINNDGTPDFDLFGGDFGFIPGGGFDGRLVSWTQDLATGALNVFFFVEHATNTGNTVLRACAEQLGLTIADYETTSIAASAFANDFYFGGGNDTTDTFPIVFGGDKYDFALSADTIAEGGSVDMTISDSGASTGTTQLGAMVVTNSDFGAGARGGATEKTETVVVKFRKGRRGKK